MVWRIAQRFIEEPCYSLSSHCVLSKSWIYMCFESQWVRPITHLCGLIKCDLTFSYGGALYSIFLYSKILCHSGSKSRIWNHFKTAGLCGSSIFIFWMYFNTVFHNDYTNLHSYQQYTRIHWEKILMKAT